MVCFFDLVWFLYVGNFYQAFQFCEGRRNFKTPDSPSPSVTRRIPHRRAQHAALTPVHHSARSSSGTSVHSSSLKTSLQDPVPRAHS